jgi:predicted nucleic acid-binding protein
MSLADIREILGAVRALCAVRPVDLETHELGLDLAERHRFSIYDALILAAAIRAGCATLYTEDLTHGQTIERLTVRNPFAVS